MKGDQLVREWLSGESGIGLVGREDDQVDMNVPAIIMIVEATR